jgi:four helix bundle protein
MRVKNFEELIVWQNSIDLLSELFTKFGDSKSFWYRDQILRATTSISSNIAEGFERNTNKEFAHFLYIIRGSCAEVRSLLHAGIKYKQIEQGEADIIISKTKCLYYMIFKLIQSLS